MSIRKRLLQKRDRIRNKTFKENLKKYIYRLHNETIENTRKEQHLNNQESRIRNNISQDNNRKEKRQKSLTGLLKDNLKTLRNLRKNTN